MPADMSAPSRTTRSGLGIAVIGMLATMTLVGCSTETVETTGEPTIGGTLVYATGDAEPKCLDPHVGGNYPQALLAGQFLESLTSRDRSGQIIPWLADSWTEAEDGLTWEFTLRDNVTFTDGTPFDAAAVKVNIEHLKDPATQSSTGYLAMGKVDRVEVVDDRTARFVLHAPDSALLESLSQPWVAMQSPAGISRGMDENCASPVGTGPFIVDEWVKQDHVSLVRNDDYNSPPADADHDGPAYLDGIEWRFIPDSASRYAALQAGHVDVIDNPQPDTIAAAQSNDSFIWVNAPRPGASNRIELNSGKAPFDDVRVREAFIRAVDVDAGIASLFFGTTERSASPLSSAEALAFSDPSLFEPDHDRAEELLDEAGWTERDEDGYRVKDGERLTLRFPVSTNQSIPAEQSLFEQVQATAKEAGFDVDIELLDLPSWYAALAANEYEIVSAPYTKVGPDVLRILYHSDSIVPAPSGYFANLSQLDDPEVDALLAQAVTTTDESVRADLYAQAQERILAGYYLLPLYDQQNSFLVSSELHGMRALPTVSTPTFYDAWLER